MGRNRSVSRLLVVLALLRAASANAADAPLADAAERRDRAAVRALIDKGADVNLAQVDGMTALHWAAYRDDLEMAKGLVNARADVKAANRYGVAPLSMACTNGDEAMVGLLLGRGGRSEYENERRRDGVDDRLADRPNRAREGPDRPGGRREREGETRGRRP